MRWIWAFIIISMCWFVAGCTSEADREAIRQMEQATSLMQSDPQEAYALLSDSVVHPELLSPKVNARWCRLLCQLADSIGTALPYVPQLKQAYQYVERHGSVEEQIQMGLYLGRAYMDDLDQESALLTYAKVLEQSIEEGKTNQSGYISSYMGDVYQFQGMYSQAVEKYLSASRYFHQAGNFRSQGIAFRDASRNFAVMDSLDIALDYMLQADSILIMYGKLKDHASTLNGLGNIYRAKEDFQTAELYYKRAIDLDSIYMINNRLALSDLYLELGDLKSARINLDSIQNVSADKNVSVDKYYLLFLLEKEEGNLQSAIDALEQYIEGVYKDLDTKNKTNIVEAEKRHNNTKVLMQLFQLKNRQIIYIGCSVVLFLFLIVCIVLYLLKLKSHQLIFSRKENEMYLLKNQLLKREKELSHLSDQLLRQTDLLNQKMEQLYLQKEQEVESIRLQIQQKNQELLEKAAITKKIRKVSEKIIPNATQSPLSSKDWVVAYELIETLYPSVRDVISFYDLSEKEKMVCYLTMFNLSSNAEAVLMNQPVGSVNKYRQTLRKKLQINDRNVDLYDHLLSIL